jgi:hypothetical protein
MNTTIILTSTIDVHNVRCNSQTDSNDRLCVYLKSIKRWLTETHFNIVLVENSGYVFPELDNEKEMYKDRFEVITFKECDVPQSEYLTKLDDKGLGSKGNHEIFAINYAIQNSELIQPTSFLIKITARYFINELEDYLSIYNLNNVDCLTQHNRDRCEMVGCHYKHHSYVFNIYTLNDSIGWNTHIEDSWKMRTMKYKKVITCKEFSIDSTIRGSNDEYYDTI